MKSKVTFTPKPLQAKLFKAFESYSQLIEAQFTKEITTKQFEWPNRTTRGSYNRTAKGREEIGSPRDIVDSGAFRQSMVRNRVGNGYRFSWNVPYSAAILKGYKTASGTKMPARNFITPALRKLPMLSTLKKLLG